MVHYSNERKNTPNDNRRVIRADACCPESSPTVPPGRPRPRFCYLEERRRRGIRTAPSGIYGVPDWLPLELLEPVPLVPFISLPGIEFAGWVRVLSLFVVPIAF